MLFWLVDIPVVCHSLSCHLSDMVVNYDLFNGFGSSDDAE